MMKGGLTLRRRVTESMGPIIVGEGRKRGEKSIVRSVWQA